MVILLIHPLFDRPSWRVWNQRELLDFQEEEVEDVHEKKEL